MPPDSMMTAPPDESQVVRRVQRALAELRRGAAVRVTGAGGEMLVVSAAETVGEGRVPPGAVLLLAASRAALLPLDRPSTEPMVAVRLPAEVVDIRALADPSLGRVPPDRLATIPPPPLASAAIRLAKHGRLLPALLCDGVADEDTLSIGATDIDAYPAHLATDLVEVAAAAVPLEAASDTRVVAFRPRDGGAEQVAVLIGSPPLDRPDAPAPLVRLHSECFTGDVLGSLRCDCGPQLRGAIRRMVAEGGGVVLYLAQEGRGIGLASKLRAYALQDRGMDTLDANLALGWGADERDFAVAAAMLRALGFTRARLLTNNPAKVAALTAAGIATERVSHLFAANGTNDAYLATKRARFGHHSA